VAERDFEHASTLEGLRFTAQVAVPNVVQGLFRRRRTAVAIAGAARADRFAVAFLGGLKRPYGSRPLWIRVAREEALLLMGTEAIQHALSGSPAPFAPDPEPKRSGMAHFQPEALTISREPEWGPRRAFTEAVLDTGRPVHRLGDRFAAVCADEARDLGDSIDWDGFNAAVRRLTRRVVLGDGAADDAALSEQLGQLMDKSNPPGKGDPQLHDRFLERLRGHVERAEAGSLAALFSEANASAGTDVDPAGQVVHWLFAMGDTLAINALRALALIAADPAERGRVVYEVDAADLSTGDGVVSLKRLGACLQEAMRLWPTTPMLSRETTEETEWDGVRVPAGTQCLIVNTFNHRDPSRHSYADAFSPDAWLEGDAASSWDFNHLSHGPQGCPGSDLALFAGQALLGGLLSRAVPRLEAPSLTLEPPLPYSLDHFAIRLTLSRPRARDSGAGGRP
jgi:cytochrome P450